MAKLTLVIILIVVTLLAVGATTASLATERLNESGPDRGLTDIWWLSETVTSDTPYGLSLALDAAGNPHIAYLLSSAYGLKYASWTGMHWEIETVDLDTTLWSYSVSLAIDPVGRPHIAYEGSANRQLKYAYRDTTGWVVSVVDATAGSGRDVSLALDPQGRPCISYQFQQGPDVRLKYARWDGSRWQIEQVDTESVMGWQTSLALDAAGHPHISYSDQWSGLHYAVWDGARWQREVVEAPGGSIFDSSLALDAGGAPRIAYRDKANSQLKYAERRAGGWAIETIASVSPDWWGNSLKLDGAGRANVTYVDRWKDEVRWAVRGAGGWQSEVIEQGSQVNWAALALNGGRPCVVYGSSAGLHYARRLDQPVTPTFTPTNTSTPTRTPTRTATPTYTPTIPPPTATRPLPTGTPSNVAEPRQVNAFGPALAPAPQGGVILAWTDDRYAIGSKYEVFARAFTAAGVPAWDTDAALGVGSRPSVAVASDGLSYVTWGESRLIGCNWETGRCYYDRFVWARPLDQAGVVLWPDHEKVNGFTNNGWGPSIDTDAHGNLSVLWGESYDQCNNRGPCDGLSLRSYNSLTGWGYNQNVASLVYAGVSWPVLKVDAAGNQYALWQLSSGANASVRIVGYGPSSAPRWSGALRVDAGSASPTSPAGDVDDAGHVYVAWADQRAGMSSIYVQKLDGATGARLWQQDVRAPRSLSGAQFRPSVTVGPDGYVYVAWLDNRSGGYEAFAQKIGPDGMQAWPEDVRVSRHAPAPQMQTMSAVVDADGVVFISWSVCASDRCDLYLQSLTQTGVRRWQNDLWVEGARTLSAAVTPTSTPTRTPTATPTPTSTPTATPTATPVGPWFNWADPGSPLRAGSQPYPVVVDYGNLAVLADLLATIDGPAMFEDGASTFIRQLTAPNGRVGLGIKAIPGATLGTAFTLRVTAGGLSLEREGIIVAQAYLPLVLKIQGP